MTTAATTQTVELEKFLSFASCIVRIHGYINSTTAKEKGIESTADLAWEWATTGRPDSLRAAILLPEDRANGKIVADWMEKIDAKGNDYRENLYVIGVSKIVTPRLKGYAASAITAIEREKEFAQKNNPANPANADKFVGKEGEHLHQSLKFVGMSGRDSKFGWLNKYIFEDGNNRKITWETQTKLDFVQQGHVYTVKATIKKHSSWGGHFETQITRASVLNR